MGFKKFFISIIKSLIILVLATLIFSTVTINFPNLIKGIFGDIFEYASPNVQRQVVDKLTETCPSLDNSQNTISVEQLCVNESMMRSMKENCNNYRELKRKGVQIENERRAEESCQQIESGEIERACNEIKQKGSLTPNLGNINNLCKDYEAGKINDKEFFFNFLSGSFPAQQMEMPQIKGLEKYNQLITYLNNNKIVYFAVLSILIILLYFLIMDIKLFLVILSQISFSIGFLVMMPYLAILAYDKFVGIDTTPILGSMFGTGNAFEPKAIVSVILLLFLRTYNSFIITLGILFLAIGIAGKVYWFILKRKSEAIKKSKEGKSKKKEKVKELLDELEETAKKKK